MLTVKSGRLGQKPIGKSMSYVSLSSACEILNSDGIVGVPTETVYGLAGRIDSQLALKKIFATKERPFFDPLIVHVTNLEQARPLVKDIAPIFEDLAKTFWPGPLTLVMEKSSRVNDLITSGLPSVALRSPRHELAQKILAQVGPFAAPSANRFGKTSPTTAEHVLQEFGEQVSVVDGGPCEVGVESTVVRVNNGHLEILRPGRILKKDLEPIAERHGLKVIVAPSEASPGHLPHHYQPEVPLFLLKFDYSESELRQRISKLIERTDFTLHYLQLSKKPHEAARTLYAELRKLSQNPGNIIAVKRSDWIWSEDSTDLIDRLTRASTAIF